MSTDNYSEINREMSLDDESGNTINATLKVNAAELTEAVSNVAEGSNDPAKPLVMQNLELDGSAKDELTQKPLSKYRFVRGIGHGGMKMVLQVHDKDTTRDVAMAVLSDVVTRPRKDVTQFIREARITAALEHPNIVPVHDLGIDATGAPYYTMKLLRGRSLAALLTKLAEGDEALSSMYTLNRMMRVFMKICYGVSFAHSRGVIHLDLKPENIQIGDFGEVLILDWGLAKVIDRASFEKRKEQAEGQSVFHLGEDGQPQQVTEPPQLGGADETSDSESTQDGIMKGTPGYMAPEQAAGLNHKLDFRTDIYALGAILYAMVTLRNPLEEKGLRERVQATMAGHIIPPRERAPERDIPAAVEAIIMKAMRLRPERRYQSVREIRDEINSFLNGFATRAEHASYLRKTFLFAKRNWLISIFTVILLFGGFIGLTYLSHYRNTKGDWKPLRTVQLDKKSGKRFQYSVIDSKTGQVRPPHFASQGLVLKSNEMIDFGRVSDMNFRFDIVLQDGVLPDKLDILVYSDGKALRDLRGNQLPPGYAFRHGDMAGYDSLAVKYPGNVAARNVAFRTTGQNQECKVISIIKTQTAVSIIFNHDPNTKIELSNCIIHPLDGANSIALRCNSGTLHLNSAVVQVETLPDIPPVTAKGDVCLEAGQYYKAIGEYMQVADLYPYQTVSDDALVRAYAVAVFKLKDTEMQQRIRGVIANRPAFGGKARIRGIDAVHAWSQGDHTGAMNLLKQSPSNMPDSDVLKSILSLPSRKIGSGTVARQFISYLERCVDIEIVDLTGYGIPIPKRPKKKYLLEK